MPEDATQPYLKSLYVERAHGRLLALATNRKLLAVELVDAKSQGPDESCFVAFDPKLIAQAEAEMPFASRIDFNVMRPLGMTLAQTMYGYTHPGNVGVFPTVETDGRIWSYEWRTWFPDVLPSESYGQMEWHCSHIAALAKSAPSGEIVFPTFIDTRVPCVMRDIADPNWCGLFFPHLDTNKRPPPLRLPKW